MNEYYVYMLASKRTGTLYIGVTNDLLKRVFQHKNDEIKSFTEKYMVHCLVWHKSCGDVNEAINREKQLKVEPEMEACPHRELGSSMAGFIR